MVKRTRKNPSSKPPHKLPRKPPSKPARRSLLGAASDHDAASIDALFDDFARNLARKIAHRTADSIILTKDGSS